MLCGKIFDFCPKMTILKQKQMDGQADRQILATINGGMWIFLYVKFATSLLALLTFLAGGKWKGRGETHLKINYSLCKCIQV